MKTVKSTGKVNKPTFFDRVRNYSQKDLDLNQNIDINRIRQSNYKLQRTKSFRTDHSLQRKVPIIAQNLQYSKSREHLHKTTLQTEISEDFKENNYRIRLQDGFKHNKENECKSNLRDSQKSGQNSEFCRNKKKQNNKTHFNEILGLLKTGLSKNQKNEVRQTSSAKGNGYLDLQEEEQCLNLIKMVWQGISLMKQRSILRQQAIKMEDLLKRQVIKLAKPKLQILQEASTLSLKIFPFGTTPVEKGVNQNSQLSIHNFNYKSQSEQQSSQQQCFSLQNCISKTSDQQSKQQLEYKKIMYILEQSKKNKLTDMIEQSRSEQQTEKEYTISIQRSESQQDQLVRSRQKLQHLSSFNSAVSATDKQTVYEQEKNNKSYSNDKLFLKNIVKKAKRVDSRLQHANQPNAVSDSKRNNKNNGRAISSIESEVHEPITEEQEELADSFKGESNTISLQNSQSVISFNKFQGNSKVTSEASSAKGDGESKRTTLNNIVNMLNHRYNKKIRLQPPK